MLNDNENKIYSINNFKYGRILIGFIMFDSNQYFKYLLIDNLEVTALILLFSSSMVCGIAITFFLLNLACLM